MQHPSRQDRTVEQLAGVSPRSSSSSPAMSASSTSPTSGDRSSASSASGSERIQNLALNSNKSHRQEQATSLINQINYNDINEDDGGAKRARTTLSPSGSVQEQNSPSESGQSMCSESNRSSNANCQTISINQQLSSQHEHHHHHHRHVVVGQPINPIDDRHHDQIRALTRNKNSNTSSSSSCNHDRLNYGSSNASSNKECPQLMALQSSAAQELQDEEQSDQLNELEPNSECLFQHQQLQLDINYQSGGGSQANGGAMANNSNVKQVELFGVKIVALTINSRDRLCLAQISNTLLKEFSYNEIHNRRVALGITCVQCTPIQLEMLRRAGAMPSSSRRCGMITMREAERLCRSFLVEEQPPELPDNFYFTVAHRINYGCRGRFVPARYISSRAKCIECFFCGDFFSPNKFIFHSHRQPHANECNPPDSPNINSWRKHIDLDWNQEHSQDIKYAWEDVKSLFNGGTRKRGPPFSAQQASELSPTNQSAASIIGSPEASSHNETNSKRPKRTLMPDRIGSIFKDRRHEHDLLDVEGMDEDIDENDEEDQDDDSAAVESNGRLDDRDTQCDVIADDESMPINHDLRPNMTDNFDDPGEEESPLTTSKQLRDYRQNQAAQAQPVKSSLPSKRKKSISKKQLQPQHQSLWRQAQLHKHASKLANSTVNPNSSLNWSGSSSRAGPNKRQHCSNNLSMKSQTNQIFHQLTSSINQANNNIMSLNDRQQMHQLINNNNNESNTLINDEQQLAQVLSGQAGLNANINNLTNPYDAASNQFVASQSISSRQIQRNNLKSQQQQQQMQHQAPQFHHYQQQQSDVNEHPGSQFVPAGLLQTPIAHQALQQGATGASSELLSNQLSKHLNQQQQHPNQHNQKEDNQIITSASNLARPINATPPTYSGNTTDSLLANYNSLIAQQHLDQQQMLQIPRLNSGAAIANSFVAQQPNSLSNCNQTQLALRQQFWSNLFANLQANEHRSAQQQQLTSQNLRASEPSFKTHNNNSNKNVQCPVGRNNNNATPAHLAQGAIQSSCESESPFASFNSAQSLGQLLAAQLNSGSSNNNQMYDHLATQQQHQLLQSFSANSSQISHPFNMPAPPYRDGSASSDPMMLGIHPLLGVNEKSSLQNNTANPFVANLAANLIGHQTN